MSLKCILQGQDSKNLATKEELNEHIEDKSNPHEVTAEQVGVYNKEYIDTTLSNYIRHDAAQSLTDGQKTQARSNIGAAPGGYGGDGETLPFYNLTDSTGDLLKAKLIELFNDDTVTKPFKKHFTFKADPFLGAGWSWFGELLSGQNDSGFKRLFLHGYNFAPATQHMWMTAFENDSHEWEWNGPYWQSLDNLPNA